MEISVKDLKCRKHKCKNNIYLNCDSILQLAGVVISPLQLFLLKL